MGVCGLISCFQTIIDTSGSPVIRSPQREHRCPLLTFVVFVPRGGGLGLSWQEDWVLNCGVHLMVFALGYLPSLSLFTWNFGSPLSRETLHTAAPQECGWRCRCWVLRAPFRNRTQVLSGPSVDHVLALASLVLAQQRFTLIYRRRVNRGTWVPVCGCCVHMAGQELSLSTGKDSTVPPQEWLASFWNLAQTSVRE